MAESTFFITFNKETKRVVGNVHTFADMVRIFHSKFAGEALELKTEKDVVFSMKDSSYGVDYDIENFADVTEGTVVTAKVSVDRLKRKVAELQDSRHSKRQKTSNKPLNPGAFCVRVRGMPWSATEADIKLFFEGCEFADEEGIVLIMETTGRGRGGHAGECFCEFKTAEDLEKAMKKHKEHMGHRYIEVLAATGEDIHKARNPSSRAPLPVQDGSFLVRLRGLPFECTKDDILAFFTKKNITPRGGLDGIHQTKDRVGRTDGGGYVEFETAEQQSAAMQLNREHIGTRYIEVFTATIEDARLPRYYV